jgi:site-specific recombinase XerD
VVKAVRRPRGPVTVEGAVDAFLAQPDLAATTVRSYRITLDRLAGELGSGHRLRSVTGDELDATLRRLWSRRAPATWNRQVATVRSFLRFCHRQGWLSAEVQLGAVRRREHADRTRSVPLAGLERLWRRSDVAVREKATWSGCSSRRARPGCCLV